MLLPVATPFLADKISSVKEVMNTLEREFFLATHKLV